MTLRLGKLAGMSVAVALAMPASAAPAPVAKPAAFAMCAVCHKIAAGEKPTLGPNLFGVGGRKAGSSQGFSYSPAMTKANFAWTRPKLIAFITAPQQVVPGTKMAFAGQKNPETAAAIADYLLSLK